MGEPVPDLGELAGAVAGAMAQRAAGALADAGFTDVREPHELVVRSLTAGDTRVTELAARLRVSPQAVSKTVAELVRAGYVTRGHDARDQRARPLVMTERGQALVDASRRARQAAVREVSRWLGARDTAELVRLLERAAEPFGDAQATRRTGMRL